MIYTEQIEVTPGMKFFDMKESVTVMVEKVDDELEIVIVDKTFGLSSRDFPNHVPPINQREEWIRIHGDDGRYCLTFDEFKTRMSTCRQ